jgi:Lrp/AsnC family transcriptional regulator for asnA, asnC and gidA
MKLNQDIGIVGIELERDALMGKKRDEVVQALCAMEQVTEVYGALAPFDLLLKVEAKNIAQFRSIITRIAAIDGVMATNTMLATEVYKERA